jgi:hypothetical protein
MKQNKFPFESENLVVDWSSLKFQYLDNLTMMEIANYLFLYCVFQTLVVNLVV